MMLVNVKLNASGYKKLHFRGTDFIGLVFISNGIAKT